jgi:hypothetical protein
MDIDATSRTRSAPLGASVQTTLRREPSIPLLVANALYQSSNRGTTAIVTNTDTGQSAQVTIQDRGPYVVGRIVDLSASTARKIGITQQKGIATVTVAPISVPLPDGSTKRGAATLDAKPGEIGDGTR